MSDWLVTLLQSMKERNSPLYVLRQTVRVKLKFNCDWDQLCNWTHTSKDDILQLNPNFVLFENFSEGTQVIIPGKALNVSYSIDGLKWTVNKYAKSLYYENAYLQHNNGNPRILGKSMKRKADVAVLPFVPKDHILGSRMDHDAQKAEYLWCNKAIHLLYGADAVERKD